MKKRYKNNSQRANLRSACATAPKMIQYSWLQIAYLRICRPSLLAQGRFLF
nr:MAG TPA: hypothetical protein [Caudoviricetes sp.]DAT61668.1 MAG TPA: hypothetical protein [Caudoviricetes sp.]